jgi:hypothetical protein
LALPVDLPWKDGRMMPPRYGASQRSGSGAILSTRADYGDCPARVLHPPARFPCPLTERLPRIVFGPVEISRDATSTNCSHADRRRGGAVRWLQHLPQADCRRASTTAPAHRCRTSLWRSRSSGRGSRRSRWTRSAGAAARYGSASAATRVGAVLRNTCPRSCRSRAVTIPLADLRMNT